MDNRETAAAFITAWKNGQTEFTIRTSGSTGEPKDIILDRKWMQWSAAHTALYLNPSQSDKILCCLPVTKVGGLMMLVRALEWGIPVEVHEASANPIQELNNASIISLSPFQLYHIMQDPESTQHLLRFREVLLGGGEINYMLEKQIQALNTSTVFRHSYGMTETYSHIALRNLNGPNASEWFTPFDDVEILQDSSGCAVIYTPFTPQGLNTNDMIEPGSGNRFRVKGRKDFIINTGGVKLQPEVIEQQLLETTGVNIPFILSSKKDATLGNKLVLVSRDKHYFETLDLQFLKAISPYAIPKEFIQVDPLPMNEGGKIDRLKVIELLNK